MALAETLLRKIHKLGLIPKVIKFLPICSFLLAISSILYLLVLPFDGNFRNTYISENALMPAQVTSYFRESEWNIVRGYRDAIKKIVNEETTRNSVVESWLNDLGITTAYHDDTLYGIMHAPRGENTEAMALVVPWNTTEGVANTGGLALELALARYFSKMSIWSKNILFVFPPDSRHSLRNWVDAYHTNLDLTGGSIDAAVILEYDDNLGDYFEFIDLFYHGLNGQLPNLDLLNTANVINYHEGIKVSIEGIDNSNISYKTRLLTLFKGIISACLTGLTKSNTNGCEEFSGWQIQAITLRARGQDGYKDITQLGRVIDGTFRSVNNLLEKFHQSFFFYLLMSSKNFISIGTYLPSAIILAVSFALSSIHGIIQIDPISNLSFILQIFTLVEVVCLILALVIPKLILQSDEVSPPLSLLLSSLSFVPTISKVFPKTTSKQITSSLISLSLLVISLAITALLIVHFSLALTMGVLLLPLTFIPTLLNHSGFNSYIAGVICVVVSNPFFIILLVGNLINEDLFSGVVLGWVDLQCWTWLVVSLVWFPCWIVITGCFMVSSQGNPNKGSNKQTTDKVN
ncbi:GPI transamidase component GAA1 [Spathaspora sp. JA1]|nr:GPI transamidase component GAA1 [Spathaspora sp. JA1]